MGLFAAKNALGERIARRVTKWQAFWIANVITVTGDRRAAEALARAPGVLEIASEMKIDEPERPLAAPLNRVGEFDFALVSGN